MISNFDELIKSTTYQLGLSHPGFVEKDYYVTCVLHALADIESEYYQLVFIGGTCLAKAHRILQRMSEDIDFKIVPKESLNSLNINAAREQIRIFRQIIFKTIEEKVKLTLQPKQIRIGNSSKFTQVFLNYPSLYSANPILRQEIKIELTVQPIYLPPERLPVTSLIQEVIGEKANLPTKNLNCISIHETSAEKWAALARRVAQVERQQNNSEKSIIRHLYDLHQMETKQGINKNFERLIPQTILRDRERFKGKNPFFYQNTLSELLYGLEALVKNSIWKERYNYFLNNMVFQKTRAEFEDALETLSKLNKRALAAIEQHSTFKNCCI